MTQSKKKLLFTLLLCPTLGVFANEYSNIAELPEVDVIGTSPLGSVGIPIDDYAGNIQTINNKKIPSDASDIADLLNKSIGSINLNDTQGNIFQQDLNFRGFTASPVLGTAQGLSVFIDSVRVNEPFGDVVSWDTIPKIALSNATVVPGSNPIYGLNTLGGALILNTKSGFEFSGSDVTSTLGSFGRKSIDAQSGGHTQNTDYYVATSIYSESGWAIYNPSTVRQFFAKTGFQDSMRDIDFSVNYSNNTFFGNQTVPLSSLDQAASGYSHFDSTQSESLTMNLKLITEIDQSNSMSSNVYYRYINRSILNSNINNPTTMGDTCSGPIGLDACTACNLLTSYRQDIYGGNIQESNQSKIFNFQQTMTIGLNYEYAKTRLNNAGQDAYLDDSRGVIGVDSYYNQASVSSNNNRYGLFITDTFYPNQLISVTASSRYDYATIKLGGLSCDEGNANNNLCTSLDPATNSYADVSGVHTYQRLNPSLGLSYKLSPTITTFASYSEGFRTPSAIELACADPSAPCQGIPNAFSADPNLKAVVAKTYEFGYRTHWGDALNIKTAVFLSNLYNDIYFNQSTLVTGYFSNIGQTRREGVEMSLDGQTSHYEYVASVTYVDATFQSPFIIANQSNSAADLPVQAGDHMPSIPAWTAKLNLIYKPTSSTSLSLGVHSQTSQYARGDENNADINGPLPGFSVFRVGLAHKFNKTFEISGGVNNLFNSRYSNFGALSSNNILTGNMNQSQNEQFRSIGAPRSYSLGLKINF